MSFRLFKPECKKYKESNLVSLFNVFINNKNNNQSNGLKRSNVDHIKQFCIKKYNNSDIDLNQRIQKTSILIKRYQELIHQRDKDSNSSNQISFIGLTNTNLCHFRTLLNHSNSMNNLLVTQVPNDINKKYYKSVSALGSLSNQQNQLEKKSQSNSTKSILYMKNIKPKWFNYTSKSETHKRDDLMKYPLYKTNSKSVSHFAMFINDPLAYEEYDEAMVYDKNYQYEKLKKENEYFSRNDNIYDNNRYRIFGSHSDIILPINNKYSIHRIKIMLRKDNNKKANSNKTHPLIFTIK